MPYGAGLFLLATERIIGNWLNGAWLNKAAGGGMNMVDGDFDLGYFMARRVETGVAEFV